MAGTAGQAPARDRDRAVRPGQLWPAAFPKTPTVSGFTASRRDRGLRPPPPMARLLLHTAQDAVCLRAPTRAHPGSARSLDVLRCARVRAQDCCPAPAPRRWAVRSPSWTPSAVLRPDLSAAGLPRGQPFAAAVRRLRRTLQELRGADRRVRTAGTASDQVRRLPGVHDGSHQRHVHHHHVHRRVRGDRGPPSRRSGIRRGASAQPRPPIGGQQVRFRRCWNCGEGTFSTDLAGELHCLVCGRQALPPMTMAAAARLGGVSLRTVKRWVDAGLVAASPAMGSGRPRLADAAGVPCYVVTTPPPDWTKSKTFTLRFRLGI